MPETLKIHEFLPSTPSVPSTSIDLIFSSRTELRLDKYQVELNRRLKTFKSNRTGPIGSVRFSSVRFELNNTISDPSKSKSCEYDFKKGLYNFNQLAAMTNVLFSQLLFEFNSILFFKISTNYSRI